MPIAHAPLRCSECRVGTQASADDRPEGAVHVPPLRDENVVRRMGELGSMPANGERTTPEGAQAFWRAEVARWKPLLDAAGQFAD